MLYQQGNVSIDERFARFGSKSFAINKITSVDVRSETKRGSQTYALWWALAAFAGAAAVVTFEAGWVLVALVFGWLGWQSWTKRANITTYRLFLVTSSAEAQATETQDKQAILDLRSAIEDAMARSN